MSLERSTRCLLGIGLYTPADAGRLLRLDSKKISRWLRGHKIGDSRYEPLWAPQVDLGENEVVLTFRDLQEVRVAAAFMAAGLSPQRMRQAIQEAKTIISDERPLSTARFRTDGRTIFLQIAQDDGQQRLIDVFKQQYAFRNIVEKSLSNVDLEESGVPARWWPMGKAASVVIDPARSFGQPIEAETAVPTAILAAATKAEGSAEAAARAWSVPLRAVKRAVEFDDRFGFRQAA